MTGVRVIGLGSPYGDDRVGWLAVAHLRRAAERPEDAGGVALLALDRPGIGLLEAMHGAEAVVLVDGVRSGAAPGTLHRLSGEALARAAAARGLSCHDVGPAEALALASALGEAPPFVVLHGMEIGPVGEPAAVSRAVACRLPALLRALQTELRRLCAGLNPWPAPAPRAARGYRPPPARRRPLGPPGHPRPP